MKKLILLLLLPLMLLGFAACESETREEGTPSEDVQAPVEPTDSSEIKAPDSTRIDNTGTAGESMKGGNYNNSKVSGDNVVDPNLEE